MRKSELHKTVNAVTVIGVSFSEFCDCGMNVS